MPDPKNLTGGLFQLFRTCKSKLAWRRSRAGLATTEDLHKFEQRLNMKVSELKNDVNGIKAQVTKVFGEQQTALDNANAKVAELEQIIANSDGEVPQDVIDGLTELKAAIQAVDDKIPDTTA